VKDEKERWRAVVFQVFRLVQRLALPKTEDKKFELGKKDQITQEKWEEVQAYIKQRYADELKDRKKFRALIEFMDTRVPADDWDDDDLDKFGLDDSDTVYEDVGGFAAGVVTKKAAIKLAIQLASKNQDAIMGAFK